MSRLSLLSAVDVQEHLSHTLEKKRKLLKLSRTALAEKSTVPASTIKKFERSGQISLRQFILLWQCLDDLQRLFDLTKVEPKMPTSIDDVLNQ